MSCTVQQFGSSEKLYALNKFHEEQVQKFTGLISETKEVKGKKKVIDREPSIDELKEFSAGLLNNLEKILKRGETSHGKK